MSFVIAVDYDGTLFEGSYTELGKPRREVINKVLEFQKAGMCEIVLWTCREAGCLQEAMERCKAEGIIFDAVNTNSPFENKYREVMLKKTGHIFANKKIYADLYVDDKSPGSIEYFLGLDVQEECEKIRKRDKSLDLDGSNSDNSDNGENQSPVKDELSTQNELATQDESQDELGTKYIATQDLIGFNPDGPDLLNNDDGTIHVKKGMLLQETGQFDEYAVEYIMEDLRKVMLHRERVCDDSSSNNYYFNYFSCPKGLQKG